MCQHLEYLHNSVNQYFPVHEVSKSCMSKKFMQSVRKVNGLYLTQKIMYYVSNFTLQETPFVRFWYSIKEYDPQLSGKAIKIFLPCPTIAHVRTDFCHTLQ